MSPAVMRALLHLTTKGPTPCGMAGGPPHLIAARDVSPNELPRYTSKVPSHLCILRLSPRLVTATYWKAAFGAKRTDTHAPY